MMQEDQAGRLNCLPREFCPWLSVKELEIKARIAMMLFSIVI